MSTTKETPALPMQQSSQQIIEHLPLKQVVCWEFNARKVFDENRVNELAESIVMRGVIQPITVRPKWCHGCLTDADVEAERVKRAFSEKPDKYEIVVGEMRWRASHKAGLETIPALVRVLSDMAAREIMLIENLQRTDLTVLEEAGGYADALKIVDGEGKPKFTVETLAARLNRVPNHIRQMLRLLSLPKSAADALQSGQINFTVARQIASVPGDRLKLAVTEAVLNPQYQDHPLTSRQTQELINQEFSRQLKGASFNQKDADLVPVVLDANSQRRRGGSCEDCPFRSGNNPEEFGEASGANKSGVRPDVCTNLECFDAKTEAAWEVKRSAALKEGKRVLSPEASDKVFEGSCRISYYSPYVDLNAEVPPEILANPNVKRRPTWRKLLEGGESQPEILVARDASGAARDLVPRAQAEAAIKLSFKGKGQDCPLKAGRSAGGSSVSDAERKEREKRKLQMEVALAAMAQLSDAIQKKGMVKGFWPLLLQIAATHAGADGFWFIGKRTGVEKTVKRVSSSGRDFEDAVMSLWGKDTAETAFAAHVVELLLSQRVKWAGITSDGFSEFATLYGIDLKKVEQTVKEISAEKKAVKKPAEKTPPELQSSVTLKKAASAKPFPGGRSGAVKAQKKAPASKAKKARK